MMSRRYPISLGQSPGSRFGKGQVQYNSDLYSLTIFSRNVQNDPSSTYGSAEAEYVGKM